MRCAGRAGEVRAVDGIVSNSRQGWVSSAICFGRRPLLHDPGAGCAAPGSIEVSGTDVATLGTAVPIAAPRHPGGSTWWRPCDLAAAGSIRCSNHCVIGFGKNDRAGRRAARYRRTAPRRCQMLGPAEFGGRSQRTASRGTGAPTQDPGTPQPVSAPSMSPFVSGSSTCCSTPKSSSGCHIICPTIFQVKTGFRPAPGGGSGRLPVPLLLRATVRRFGKTGNTSTFRRLLGAVPQTDRARRG